MKKLLAAMLLAVLWSVPSMVFAEVTSYGLTHSGDSSQPQEGGGSLFDVFDNSFRWGTNGSAESPEGLTAVYRFKHKFGTTDDGQSGGPRAYIGLPSGFGTITLGQVWNPNYTSSGSTIPNSLANSQSDPTYRAGNALSYRVNFGKLRLQADAIMDRNPKKNGDSFQVGAKIDGLMDTGSVAIAHYRHADKAVKIGGFANGNNKSSSNYLVGQYGIGDMKMYLGAGQHTVEGDECSSSPPFARDCVKKGTGTSTYAGIRGGVADTGVNYVFHMVKKKVESTNNASTPVTTKKSMSPWRLGISRKLGGGASLHFETSDPDEEGESNTTGVWFKVDF